MVGMSSNPIKKPEGHYDRFNYGSTKIITSWCLKIDSLYL